MLIALLLRLFHITHESLWWDEYTSHIYLDKPSLLEFLRWNRTLDPLTLPFYYSLEYLWTHYVNASVAGLRLMSVAIGVATLPLVYALGRHIYGHRAGYAAVALMALSPVHIHHSQGIRMYVVFIFLAVVVVLSFMYLLEKPEWRLWCIHGLASFLMYWTHPFAGLVPAVLGCFLLLRYRSRVGTFWRWTLHQSLLFAPTVLYLSTVRFWPKDSTSLWIEKPGLGALLADLFFDDISVFHWQLRLSDFAQRLGTGRLLIDAGFAVMIVVLLLWAFKQIIRHDDNGDCAVTRERGLLLVLWLILPPLILFMLSWTIRPCMFPRYTVHCAVPLYLLLGIAVASIKNRSQARTALGLLVASMLLQWLWLQPGPQRTDWRSAGLFLHEQAAEGDIVLVDNFLWRDVFLHNIKHLTQGSLDLPIAAAGTQPLLAAQTAVCTGMLPKHSPPGQIPQVWAVLALDYFDPGWPAIFEECLRSWGISFERRAWPSLRRITIYKLTSPPSIPVTSMEELFTQWKKMPEPAGPWTGELDHFALQAFGDLATELALHEHTQMALEILGPLLTFERSSAREIYGNLYASIQTNGDITAAAAAVRKLWDGYGFRENGQSAYACQAFEEALTFDARYAIARLELGYELYALGQYPDAADAFAQAIETDSRHRILNNLVRALRSGQGIHQAFDAVQAYRQGILAQSSGDYEAAATLLRQATAADPHLDDAHTSLVFVLITQRKIDEARKALDAYFAVCDPPEAGAYGLLAVTHIARNEPDKALECVDKAIAMDEAYGKQFGPFFYALLRDRDYEKTIRAMDVLNTQGVNLYPLLHEYVKHLLH